MNKIQKRIEILRTTIGMRSIGLESSEAMLETLSIYYEDVRVTIVNDVQDLERLVARRPDLAISGVKFITSDRQGLAISVTEYLKKHNINHTGSGKLAIDLENDKPLAKQCVQDAGISTAKFLVIEGCQLCPEDITPLQFPVFIKPSSSGGGDGIDEYSIAHDMKNVHAKIATLKTKNTKGIIIEEYLPGREFSVALLRHKNSKKLIAMPIELVAPTNKQGVPMLSHDVKTSNQEVILPVNDPITRAIVINTAKRAFEAIGARDYGRIDIRMDKFGVPHFLEANLIPSLISGYGSFPKACVLNIGMNYETMMLHIVSIALERTKKVRQVSPVIDLATLLVPARAAVALG